MVYLCCKVIQFETLPPASNLPIKYARGNPYFEEPPPPPSPAPPHGREFLYWLQFHPVPNHPLVSKKHTLLDSQAFFLSPVFFKGRVNRIILLHVAFLSVIFCISRPSYIFFRLRRFRCHFSSALPRNTFSFFFNTVQGIFTHFSRNMCYRRYYFCFENIRIAHIQANVNIRLISWSLPVLPFWKLASYTRWTMLYNRGFRGLSANPRNVS